MGGLKSQELTASTRLDPLTALIAIDRYRMIMNQWNAYLANKNLEQVKLICPVGSTSYIVDDFDENVDVTYGDIDYLVEFPISLDHETSNEDVRKFENEIIREYEGHMADFILGGFCKLVNVASLKGSPLLTIINLPDGKCVQVDTIVTFKSYENWMPTRWKPIRGVKGYVTGNLYTAFGEYFDISIGDRGACARTRDGRPVPFRMRKDTKLEVVGKDMSVLFQDVARYLTGVRTLNLPHPGVLKNNVNLLTIASGIREVVEIHDWRDPENSLRIVYNSFTQKLAKSVREKQERGLSDNKVQDLLRLNSEISQQVYGVFFS